MEDPALSNRQSNIRNRSFTIRERVIFVKEPVNIHIRHPKIRKH